MRVQHGHASIGGTLAGTVSLPATPAPGNMLILAGWSRAGDVSSGLPAGFTVLEYIAPTVDASYMLAWRRVQTGDSKDWTSPIAPGRMLYLAEWSALSDPTDSTSSSIAPGAVTSPRTIASAGSAGDLIFAMFGLHTDIPGREPHVTGSTTLEFEDWVDGGVIGFGPYVSAGTIDYPGPAEATYPSGSGFHYGAMIAATFPEGAAAPPADPGYTPPAPAKAILEIYVHDESASRWGTATWATGSATGTEGIWSAAGWTDVTPEGVTAHIFWGSRRPDRGILADQDAATWNVQTYDPDRKLDPGNPDSPFYPELVPGLPIRISHGATIIRTGYCDEITYNLARPDYQGQIIGSDNIAVMAQADVPEDSILGNYLIARINDAIIASGIAIGGLPINPKTAMMGPTGSAGPALSARPTGKRSVWDIARLAAREVLWVPYITRTGELRVRPWGAPLDRGREIADPMLIDMQSKVTEDGLVSVVRVKDAAGTSTIERVAAPLPRYGRRALDRSEKTIDPEAWADAILADRAWPGVSWIPGTIRPRTAADVDMLGTLEIMERVTLTVPGVVSVQGRILGGELWVQHRENDLSGAKWSFRFAVATDGSTAIGTTTLVSDVTGDTLTDDATGTDYLEAN